MRDPIRTHIKGFDEALGGGVPQGHIVLLRGASGTMKSTVAYYVLHRNAVEGHKALYVTLEQSPKSILEQMSELGMDVSSVSGNLHVLDLSRGRDALEALAAGMRRAGGPEPKRDFDMEGLVRSHFERVQREGEYSLMALDSWDALESLLEFDNDRLDAFRFLEWLRGLGVTCFLITELAAHGKGDTSHAVEFLADAIMNLRLDLAGPNEFQRRIQCAKLRGANHSTDFFTLLYEGSRFEIVKAISGGDV